MGAYIVRRTLLSVFTLLVISFLSWVIIQLPEGDYVDWYVEQELRQSLGRPTMGTIEEYKERTRIRLGLYEPLMVQYWDWMSGIVFRGDFGLSFTRASSRIPIRDIIAEAFPTTIALTGFTIAITWMLAIPIGIYSAVRHHSIGDYAFTFLGFTGIAVPDFLLGLVLMYFFFAVFDMSVGGLFSADYRDAAWSFGKLLDLLRHLIIPAIVLGTSGMAGLIRIMRNNLLDELDKPYVVTARAKGLANWRAVTKYPVRIAFNPFISSIGSTLPALVGGSVIVSVVLSLPTLGPILLDALKFENTKLAGSIILILGALTVVGVLISDLLLVLVDPRIRLTGPGR